MYRPEGWERPHKFMAIPSLEVLAKAQDTDAVKFYQNESYEAGADAMYEPAYEKGKRDMLERLRSSGQRVDVKEWIGNCYVPYLLVIPTKGTLVFIPDD